MSKNIRFLFISGGQTVVMKNTSLKCPKTLIYDPGVTQGDKFLKH